MIDEICSTLAEAGLTKGIQRPPINIEITRGDALVAYVFIGSGTFIHIKASELTQLLPAYRAQEAAWRALQKFVPQPLCFFSRNGWDLAVSEGIDALPVQADHLKQFQGVRADDLLTVMTGLIPDNDIPPAYADPQSLLEAILTDFSNKPEAALIERWLGTDAISELCALPVRPQHGDFVPNNLGVTDHGLIVFDWEDYGVVNLAGFDLCTLIAATLDFRAEAIFDVIAGHTNTESDWWSPLIIGYCNAVGIEVTTFRRMIPLHLAIFLFLKKRYGSDIKRAVSLVLHELISRGC